MLVSPWNTKQMQLATKWLIRVVKKSDMCKNVPSGFKSVLRRKRNEPSELLEVGADVDCVKNKVS